MVSAGFFVFFVALAGVLTAIIFFEYRLCRHRMEQLRDIKEDYCAKIQELKRIIDEYEPPEKECEIFAHSKKKNRNEDRDTFLVLNRCPEYLKESTVAYMREQNLDTVLNRINDDQWYCYTEQMIKAEKKAQQKKRACPRVVCSSPQRTKVRSAICLAWPIKRSQFWISSFFGPRKNPNGTWRFHRGVDMAALKGTLVTAAASGRVIEARCVSGYGKTIVIQHSTMYKTRYAHLHEILVHRGQSVIRGQCIGKVGSTGLVRGKDPSHLHFELYTYGKQVNPMPFLS
jgi:murein DD-endopeptidase MepM/ murein hydrolase activator NlpD